MVVVTCGMLMTTAGTQVIGMHHASASATATAAAHAAGKDVYVWTANTPAMVRSALSAAADAVVTDFPAMAMQLVHDAWSQCRTTLA